MSFILLRIVIRLVLPEFRKNAFFLYIVSEMVIVCEYTAYTR